MVMFAGRVKIRINANHPKRIKNVKELPIILTDEYNIDVPALLLYSRILYKKICKKLRTRYQKN